MRPWRWHKILSVTFSCVLTLSTSSVLADSPLKRLTLRHDLLGFEGVGRLDLGDGFCSGALIAPDLVLTAAHCLIDEETGQRRDPRHAIFRAGFRDGGAIAERSGARAVLHPDYDPSDPDPVRQLVADIALIQLEHAIPAGEAAPFALSEGPGTGGQVSVVSYARERASAPSWQRRCDLVAHGMGASVMSCDTHFGSSGAPVFDVAAGRPRIVSVISRGAREGGKSVVWGVSVEGTVPRLKAELRSGRGVWPTRAQPGPRRLSLGGRSGQNGSEGARFLRP